MPSLLRTAARTALDLLYPPRCVLCSTGGTLLCDLCVAILPLADGPRCLICWSAISRGDRRSDRCLPCRDAAPAFTAVRSPFEMSAGARSLVHRLKYDALTSLGDPMSALMTETAAALMTDHASTATAPDTRPRLVVPVPLHSARERDRGYNQARLLAEPLARALSLDIDPRAARRIRRTADLVHAMSRDERRQIVAGAFAADATRVANRRILLVDDVTTTGATLDACATALFAAGATSVSCVTFARAGSPIPERD